VINNDVRRQKRLLWGGEGPWAHGGDAEDEAEEDDLCEAPGPEEGADPEGHEDGGGRGQGPSMAGGGDRGTRPPEPGFRGGGKVGVGGNRLGAFPVAE